MDMLHVGDNIRKLRELKNYTQEYMADKLKMARETYGKIERGELGLKVETIFNIATLLEVSVTRILDFDPQQFFNHSNNNSLINGSNSQIHPPAQDDLLKVISQTFKMLQEQHTAIMDALNKKIV